MGVEEAEETGVEPRAGMFASAGKLVPVSVPNSDGIFMPPALPLLG